MERHFMILIFVHIYGLVMVESQCFLGQASCIGPLLLKIAEAPFDVNVCSNKAVYWSDISSCRTQIGLQCPEEDIRGNLDRLSELDKQFSDFTETNCGTGDCSNITGRAQQIGQCATLYPLDNGGYCEIYQALLTCFGMAIGTCDAPIIAEQVMTIKQGSATICSYCNRDFTFQQKSLCQEVLNCGTGQHQCYLSIASKFSSLDIQGLCSIKEELQSDIDTCKGKIVSDCASQYHQQNLDGLTTVQQTLDQVSPNCDISGDCLTFAEKISQCLPNPSGGTVGNECQFFQAVLSCFEASVGTCDSPIVMQVTEELLASKDAICSVCTDANIIYQQRPLCTVSEMSNCVAELTDCFQKAPEVVNAFTAGGENISHTCIVYNDIDSVRIAEFKTCIASSSCPTDVPPGQDDDITKALFGIKFIDEICSCHIFPSIIENCGDFEEMDVTDRDCNKVQQFASCVTPLVEQCPDAWNLLSHPTATLGDSGDTINDMFEMCGIDLGQFKTEPDKNTCEVQLITCSLQAPELASTLSLVDRDTASVCKYLHQNKDDQKLIEFQACVDRVACPMALPSVHLHTLKSITKVCSCPSFLTEFEKCGPLITSLLETSGSTRCKKAVEFACCVKPLLNNCPDVWPLLVSSPALVDQGQPYESALRQCNISPQYAASISEDICSSGSFCKSSLFLVVSIILLLLVKMN